MGGIFISYRRSDSEGHAGRLYDRLKDRFGAEQVFRDIDQIEPGANFIDVLNRALGSCSVLLAVIGKTWLTTADATGRRRLDDPDDLTRLEIKTALERGIRVIPVLVQGAVMGSPQDLPEDLRKLSYIQALELSTTRWDYDIDLLIKSIEKDLDLPPKRNVGQPGAKGTSDTSSSSIKKLVIGAAVLGVLGVGIVMQQQGKKQTDSPPTPVIQPKQVETLPKSELPSQKSVKKEPVSPTQMPVNKEPEPPAQKPMENVKPDTSAKSVPVTASKVMPSRYSVSLSEDRGTLILTKGSDEKHISLDPDRVQKIYTAPGGGWCLAVFKVRGQSLYGALPINLTRGAEGTTEELPTMPDEVSFAGKEAVVKLAGGDVRRIHLN